MAIYSLTQYTTTVIAERYLQYPADMQYLYWDLILNFFFIVFVGYTATAKKLSIERPRSSLFSFTNLFQMMSAFALQLAGQISIIAIYQLVEADYYYSNGGMGNAIETYAKEKVFTGGI
jgi:magnesium-transporting ATPase (P-type)